MDAAQGEERAGRVSQLLYSLPIDYASDGSVDPSAEAKAQVSRLSKQLPSSVELRSRQINIGRGGDELGLLIGLLSLGVTLFYAAPGTAAALGWWRRQLGQDGVEDVMVAAAQDQEAPPLAMSPDIAALVALRRVEGADRGAAQLVWWDEVVIDRFDVFVGDGLEQSPDRIYYFVIDHTGDRAFVAMRADGIVLAETTAVLPRGWMEYRTQAHPDLAELADELSADTASRKKEARSRARP